MQGPIFQYYPRPFARPGHLHEIEKDEADFPAARSASQAYAWFPRSHGNRWWPQSDQGASCQGP